MESDYKNEITSLAYKDKIDYKFKKNPNLKYNLIITDLIDDWLGINDLFEIFTSYKDNKEYLAYPNKETRKIDIIQLIDKKIQISLEGHETKITTLKYFINNKNNNEFLISAEYERIIIIFDITNNYNIKHKINTQKDYDYAIYSVLLVFPKDSEDNYIIISTSNIAYYYQNTEITSAKIYSLNDGSFIKYINNSYKNAIYYLLSWYNIKENKYYIIQLARYLIMIDDLYDDENCYDLSKNDEDCHNFFGFIYTKDNRDYLCSSDSLGYINTWDLYDKKIVKIINTNINDLELFIEWNNKYIIIVDKFYFKVFDLQQNKFISKIKDKKSDKSDKIRCIKKIYHPIYGESLLIMNYENTIKLWSVK